MEFFTKVCAPIFRRRELGKKRRALQSYVGCRVLGSEIALLISYGEVDAENMILGGRMFPPAYPNARQNR